MVTEGAAICAYLADAFPQAGLAPPPGDRLRGPYYRWLFFAAGPVEAAADQQALGVVDAAGPRADDRLRHARRASSTRWKAAVAAARVHRRRRFSAADVYVGSQIGFGLQFGTLEKRPAFERYFGALQRRPAAVRARRSTTSWPPRCEKRAEGAGGEARGGCMRLKDKAALVTGAGQGFGYGIAEAFVREGARVACLDVKAEVAAAAAKRLGPSAIALTADVSDRADVERAARAGDRGARAHVDIVVNDAGTTHRNKPVLEVTDDGVRPDFRGQCQVDLS